MGRGKREDITARRAHHWLQHGPAEPRGALLLDHTRLVSRAPQNGCLSERQADITQLHSQKKQTQHCLKNLRIAICLIPELLRYLDVSFPTEISAEYIL